MKKQLQEIFDKFLSIRNISYKEAIEVQREIERFQEIAEEKEDYFEGNSKIIAQLAWWISGNYQYGYNIGFLCKELEEDFGIDAQQTFESIYDGLEELSGEKYVFWEDNNGFNYREVEKYGYCIIDGVECYWDWSVDGAGEWTCDKPDYWDEMIEKWEEENEDKENDEEGDDEES